MKSKKIATCAVLSALAIIFGYIEALFPLPLPIPGIKLGLGNIVVIVCLYIFGAKISFGIMLIKIFTSVLLFSPPSTLIYSLCGGALSFVIMLAMKKMSFNTITVSIGSGIFHNIGQLVAAAVVLNGLNLIYYLPLLIISGAMCGFITGLAAHLITKRIV
ncbi:MAG: Gx transporter family protein [Clostridia bacterium]|nr:Gx transporter family protein [Clostridia bacterium]